MFIEIEEDIFGILKDFNSTQPQYKQIVRFLYEVVICMTKGKHYISIPSLLKQANKTLLNNKVPGIASILCLAANMESASIKRSMKWRMTVTTNDPEKNTADQDIHILYYNPLLDKCFEMYEETHLICENLYDCSFYKAIVNSYFINKHIGSQTCNYLARNGGGITTSMVVRNEASNKNHLCLIITDSDLKFEGDTKFGSTYTQIRDELKKSGSDHLHLHKLKNVREIENLIPHNILITTSKNIDKKLKEFLQKNDSAFFDFKEGLRYVDICERKAYNYWKPVMDSLKIDYSKYSSFKTAATKKEKYYKLVKDEKLLINGFGSKILSTVIEKNLKELSKTKHSALTPRQEKDWTELGELIFNWTISKKYI